MKEQRGFIMTEQQLPSPGRVPFVFTIAGYPARGNNILGLVRSNDGRGNPESNYTKDKLGLPYTTLSYANGAGYTGRSTEQSEGPRQYPHYGNGYSGITRGRPDLSNVNTAAPIYMQEATVPLGTETHGGEDVPFMPEGRAHISFMVCRSRT
jgi:alkaline phosphatase